MTEPAIRLWALPLSSVFLVSFALFDSEDLRPFSPFLFFLNELMLLGLVFSPTSDECTAYAEAPALLVQVVVLPGSQLLRKDSLVHPPSLKISISYNP